MDAGRIVVALAGLALTALSWLLARGGRLSVGHGLAWCAMGLGILLVGIAGGPAARACAASRFCGWWLLAGGLVTASLAAMVLYQAAALSRLRERVKRLAQDLALLRAELEATAGAAGGERRAERSAAADEAAGN